MRSTIFNLLFYTATLVGALTLWVLAKLTNRRVMWRALHLWAGTVRLLVRVILNAKVEVRGREHLKPHQSQLIVGKHQSELDVVMMVDQLDDFSAVVMAELANYPMFPTLLSALDLVLVAVDSGKQGRTQQTVEGGKRIAAQNRDMLIYPEGELMKLGAKERYKSGVGHLYCNMGVEVIPVAFSVGVIWPQRQWHKYPGKRGIMEFMEPIPPGLPFDDFMALIEERLETRTMELVRETASGEVLAAAEERFAAKVNNHGLPPGQVPETPPKG
ncbi:MAG: lysophospholipid acyltransferase family protein [Pseudomonadota bacterium]